jgi:hypothetical protein
MLGWRKSGGFSLLGSTIVAVGIRTPRTGIDVARRCVQLTVRREEEREHRQAAPLAVRLLGWTYAFPCKKVDRQKVDRQKWTEGAGAVETHREVTGGLDGAL